jgi:hypothetical protein
MVALAGFVLLVVGYAPWGVAGKSGQKTFASPGEACQALFQAVQHNDEPDCVKTPDFGIFDALTC